ncbi:MAG TPA: metallophosphoesterase [Fulvivirga sp.]|nr:metallophosphoesterase [Fulvivirga sp.]
MKAAFLKYLLPLLIIIGCQAPDKANTEVLTTPKFEHDLVEGPTPWTSTEFELEEEDFTFAIISDLTGGERPGIYKMAVAQLNRLDPTFVLSVGDLIEGGTEDTLQLAKEWDSFDDRTSKLNMPFFHLGGNHDLTNPLMRKFWKHRYGPTYYHFVYENVLFLMMDSEDYGDKRMWEVNVAREEAMKIIRGEKEGNFNDTEYAQMLESKVGGISAAQLDYFKKVLTQYPDVRWTFVLMHKPTWMREDSLGLDPLEALLANRNYTVINGHKHSYSHRKRNNMDYITLGTTGGFQDPGDTMAFDHVTLVRMATKPVITHLKMEGILDETGAVPK